MTVEDHAPVDMRDDDARRALLARWLRGGRPAEAGRPPAFLRRPDGVESPLAHGQRQLWLIARLAPDVPVYNEAVTVRIRPAVDIDALHRALNELIRRHEVWRTTYLVDDGRPIPRVLPTYDLALPYLDLTTEPAADRERLAVERATEDARRPFDLEATPPLRALLVRLADGDYRLYLTFHHIVFDGITVQRVIQGELRTLYHDLAAGREPSVPAPPAQYADYAYWQQTAAKREAAAADLAYWLDRLAGELPMLQLPLDRPRPSVSSFHGAAHYCPLGRDRSAAVKDAAAHRGMTPFMLLVASLFALLHRYSGQPDLLLGTVTSTRTRAELENLPGYFLNNLVLRADLSADPTVDQFLAQIRETTLAAFDHQDAPFEQLVQALQPERSAAMNPLFQVMVTLDPPPDASDPAWMTSRMDVDLGIAKFDLGVYINEGPEGYVARFEYSTDLFERETIARLARHFTTLLGAMLTQPDTPISRLPLLSAEETAQLVHEWNATERIFPRDTCIHTLFEQQVERTPHRTAVMDAHRSMTYRELNARANQLAHYLRTESAGVGTRVALYVERSADLLVALLGILKCGAAYVPLDPLSPPERLGFVLRDAGVTHVVATSERTGDLPASGEKHILLDRERASIERQSPENLTAGAAEEIAYIIYTSGSTGVPKGVQVRQRNVVNLLHALQDVLSVTAEDRLLAVTSPSFDIHVLELFLPLMQGGCTIIAEQTILADGRALLDRLHSAHGTFLQATPATWKLLVDAGWDGTVPVTAISGGDVLSASLARELLARARAVWNLYGPTETTVWSSAHQVRPGDDPIPIGRPLANTQTYILDGGMQPVPVGVAGELYIGGEGVAVGYANRPELTAERFVPHPFSGEPGSRLYRTGDLCRHLPDGTIQFLGRLDHQLKVRGHRIEAGEVEAALRRHPHIADAAVVARADAEGTVMLAAFVVAREGASIDPSVLQALLRTSLPSYMVPSVIGVLDALPLSATGKVDRKLLVTQTLDAPTPEHAYQPPSTPTEQTLAAIWQDVLGIDRVGIHDDFFELGGHSLLAVTLLDRIEREYGRKIPLASLFTAPTIAHLQEVLLAPDEESRTSPLLRVRSTGTRTPFFWLHGQPLGRGFYSLKLARTLGADQPFYVLQPHRLAGEEVPSTIEAMAADYLRYVRAIQPRGPYRIGGFCLSGIVAYEMAQQLVHQGEEVEFLAILHSDVPNFRRTRLIWRAMNLVGKVMDADEVRRRDWYTSVRDSREHAARVMRAFRQWMRGHDAGVSSDPRKPVVAGRMSNGAARIDTGMDAYFWAAATYRFLPYPGRITLLRGDDLWSGGTMLGWDRLAAEVVVVDVPPHESVLREEVDVLAARLSDELWRLDRHVPSRPLPETA